jgi:hypothetical protein
MRIVEFSSLILGGAALVLMTAGMPMRSVVEIRSYNLEPGTRAEFHRLFVEQALPMLQRWNVDVVAYGPSSHDEDSYYLMRAYANLEDRQRSQDAFYGSAEWLEGPRAPILALIESYTTIVLDLDTAAIAVLRGTLRQ